MAEQKSLQTMRTIVNRNALLFPDKTAMKEFETGKACTFLEMKEKANKIGNALYALGLSKGDPVSVLSQNSYEYAELFTSVPSAGFILVPLNFRLALPEIIGVQ